MLCNCNPHLHILDDSADGKWPHTAASASVRQSETTIGAKAAQRASQPGGASGGEENTMGRDLRIIVLCVFFLILRLHNFLSYTTSITTAFFVVHNIYSGTQRPLNFRH